MKRVAIALLAGIAAVAGLGYSASAADLAVKAPPPAPVANWTGFYVGVHGGAAIQDSKNWNFADPNLVPGVTGFNPITLGGSSASTGGVAGLQAGYNWEFLGPWVVGVEVDVSWASLSDHRTVAPTTFGGVTFNNSGVQMSQNTEWLSSLRGRFGYAGWPILGQTNTFWYGTAGIALAQTEYAAQANIGPPFNFLSNTSFTTVKTGYVVGGGVEWMATTNILLRAEYLYYGLSNGATGNAALCAGGAVPGGVCTPTAGEPNALNYQWSRDNIQVLRIAGSYKF